MFFLQFLSPLSTGVWFAILVALCVVGLILYYLERYSKLPKHDTDKFNFLESMWFVFGSLVQVSKQCKPLPKSSKVVFFAWLSSAPNLFLSEKKVATLKNSSSIYVF